MINCNLSNCFAIFNYQALIYYDVFDQIIIIDIMKFCISFFHRQNIIEKSINGTLTHIQIQINVTNRNQQSNYNRPNYRLTTSRNTIQRVNTPRCDSI